MKLTCSQSDLNTNLSLASRAVPSRPTHPVLGNVLLIADEQAQKVQLRAFDLSLGIQTRFPAQVSEGGTITLPAKLLGDIVSRLSEGEITLICEEEESETETEGAMVTLTSASGRYQFRSMNPEEFPNLPQVESEDAIALPVDLMNEGLRSTLFAASLEETKQILTGIHLTRLQADTLEFAATDGHRLAVVQAVSGTDEDEATAAPEMTVPEDFEVTIPAKALRELERMVAASSVDAIALNFDDSQVVFEFGDRHLTSRKLDGAYPNYQQLIPQQFARHITIERKQLISCLERVAVLADQKNNVVKFSLDSEKQELALSVDTTDVGNAREFVPVQISGESIDVAFNVRYLMDGLKALPSSEIQMQLNEANQPAIFTPLGGVKMTYLVMPVQLRE
ncbi:DNA polymerase III subunit beta [Lusitaniella coriacea LEGE 07157]|uniref:Beta sliding clamp n=1 Tax=Lusitaniella coriacea LEGE 07157 TaxID=945747 RepID=A0A8J7DZ43_9CYAN|nr:DNA polymerase III subunit beta [Lusitaniella coriacea]MBE9117968.1 DNA polymerase III subunit beta [Lusitaniella coriacea LEGE 07157]